MDHGAWWEISCVRPFYVKCSRSLGPVWSEVEEGVTGDGVSHSPEDATPLPAESREVWTWTWEPHRNRGWQTMDMSGRMPPGLCGG